ncbi:hypothetical protein [Micromonospora sp. NPDC093277]
MQAVRDDTVDAFVDAHPRWVADSEPAVPALWAPAPPAATE